MSKNNAMRTWLKSISGKNRASAARRPVAAPRLTLLSLEDRVTPSVQFATAGQTVNASTGTFSITVTDTDTGSDAPTASIFAAAGLTTPQNVAFDNAGNLYVSNFGGTTVTTVAPTGVISIITGFDRPRGLDIDAAGNVYVADQLGSTQGAGVLFKIDTTGTRTLFATGFTQPNSVRVDAAGNVYVANLGVTGTLDGTTVDRITPAGVKTTYATGLHGPQGLAFDAAGNLYVGNNAPGFDTFVSRVTPAGVVTTFATGFTRPSGLAFDAAGNLFVSNLGSGGGASSGGTTVSRVTPAGVVSTYATGLSTPIGLDFDAAGNLYVANALANNVIKLAPTPATVPFTLGGNAVQGTDYTITSTSPLTVPIGGTTTITGTLIPQGVANKTLTFTLGTPTGDTLGTPSVNTLTITQPAITPTLAGVSPSTAVAGSGNTTVTLTGTNFTPTGTTANFNGTPIATTFVSPTQVTAVIPAAALAAAGNGTVSVTTAAGTSGTVPFTVTAANAAATVQFTAGSETVNASSGTFSIPVTLTGTVQPTAGPFASGFSTAQGLAFDAAGNLYVANSTADTVSRVTPAGVVTTFASGLSFPIGLAFDAAGNLYVSNGTAGTVSRVTPAGAVTPFASGFSNPNGVAFDATGNLYVANATGGTVSRVTPVGAVTTFASGFNSPIRLAFDAAGSLYVSDNANGTVSKVTPAGAVTTFATLPGSGALAGLAFQGGTLHVANRGNNTIAAVSPAGVVSTFAAGVTFPYDLAFDAAGDLYFDTTGTVVFKFTPTTVTVPFTLGGTAVAGTNYTLTSPSPLTFAPGTTTVNVTGTLTTTGTGNKTLTVTLGTPAGGGTTLGTTTVNTLTIADPAATAPTLTGVSPNTAPAGSPATTVTLTGANFTPTGTTANFNGTPIATTFVSPTQVTAVIPAAALAAAGNGTVSVTTPAGTSSTVPFTVNGPTLASITPAAALVGSPATAITLTGTNFVPGSTVNFNGTLLTPTSINPTQITVAVPAAQLAAAGSKPVTVTSPGGATTSPVNFSVTNPTPTLTSITPSTAPAGSPATTVTLTGTNFVPSTTVSFNGTPLTPTSITPTQITVAVPAAQLAAAGSSPITVTNPGPGGGTTAPQTFTVGAGIAVNPATLPNPTRTQPYSQTLTAANGTGPYTFSVPANTLPTGLALDPTTGMISGTPTTNGPSTFTVTATDANGASGTRPYTLTVSDPLAITTTAIAPVSKGVAYNAPVATTGGRGPNAFAVTAGSLPAGLSISPATGVISGTPTTNGPFSFGVTATDADGRTAASPTFAGTVTDPLAITTLTLPTPTRGQPYSQPVNTTGGQSPKTFTVAGTLPLGLAIDPATGIISGTPTANGLFGFTVTATDPAGRAASQTYSETISDQLAIMTLALPPQTVGQAYSTPVATTGGRGPNAFAVTVGILPAGLALNPATGVISGMPTAAGPFSVTVQATDADGRAATQPYTGQVSNPLAVTTPSLPPASRGSAYSAPVATTGGRGPVAFAVTAGSLPVGLSISPTTGVISGTPAATGTSAFTVTATDAEGRVASKGYGLTVTDPVAFPTRTLADGTTGVRFAQAVTASGGTAPLTYAVTAGALPSGVALDVNSGAVTGTPTAPGTYKFTITATDATGVKGAQPYTIIIADPLAVVGAGTLPNGIVQLAYAQAVATTGGTGPITFALTTGALPPGLTLRADGTLAGTPTAGGVYNFTVAATDARGRTASRATAVTIDAGSNLSRVFAVASGDGGSSRVRVFDRATGAGMADFFAFEPSFRGGANTAVGDVNGDGVPDVVIAAGVGGGTRVMVVDGTKLNQVDADGRISSSAQLANFFAFDESLRGGATVALAQLDGGKGLDIVVGAGAGGGPRVRSFALTPGAAGGVTQLPGAIGNFFAFDPTQRFGVTVAAGNLDGTGVDDVIVGQGLGGPPQVAVFRPDGSVRAAFTAANLAPNGGVSVAAGYLDGTNTAQLVLGTGPGGPPLVNVYSGTSTTPVRTITAFESTFTGGVTVNSGPVGQQSDIFLGAGVGGGPRVRVLTPDGAQELYNFFPYEMSFLGGVNVG